MGTVTAEVTKEVDSFFGTKQVTRAEFVERWRKEVYQFYNLAVTTPHFKALDALLVDISEMAGAKWDSLK